jgi:LPS sulfotransferase NodH
MKLPLLPGYNPDVHREEIERHFGHAAGWGLTPGLADALDALSCFYVIAFTNRCGSNYVAQCIASGSVLRQAGENLNHDGVIRQAKANGLKSYAGYLEWVIRRNARQSGVFGCKASAGQFIGLHEAGVLAHLGDKLRVIHVRREDVVDQAVSMFIARRTQKWTSTQEGQDAEIRYDGGEIFRIVDIVTRENELFRQLFGLLGIEPLTVRYDDFIARPKRGLRVIARHLGVEELRFNKASVTYEKQAGALNRELKERFLADMRLKPA